MRKEYLKIPDDVDLKELEKFNFVYNSDYPPCKYYVFRVEKGDQIYQELAVLESCRDVGIYYCDINTEGGDENGIWDEIQNKLFDLISAGLVKKVVEDERQ